MMKERTTQILSALIKDFVENAAPVASKKLLENHNFDVSSATIRNEFALLEEVGLIESPHVSAGKVPTVQGYRYFVDELMKPEQYQDEIKETFQKYVTTYKLQKAKETAFDALRVLSHLSGNVAFAHIDNDRTIYIGLSHFVRSPEFAQDPNAIAQIVEVLEGKQRLHNFLSNQKIELGDVKIFIGEENLLEEISSCAMLVTPFQSQNIEGKIGIIGPMRMNYGYNKALLKEIISLIAL